MIGGDMEWTESDDGFHVVVFNCTPEERQEFILEYISNHLSPASLSQYDHVLKNYLTLGRSEEHARLQALQAAILNEHLLELLIARAKEILENKARTEQLLEQMEAQDDTR